MTGSVSGEPHYFPLRGTLRPETTALVVIDMQHDFLSEGLACIGSVPISPA